MWSFGPFWSVKCLNFGQKLPFRTAHHTFLESRHPEVTKKVSKKGISSWTIVKIQKLLGKKWKKILAILIGSY